MTITHEDHPVESVRAKMEYMRQNYPKGSQVRFGSGKLVWIVSSVTYRRGMLVLALRKTDCYIRKFVRYEDLDRVHIIGRVEQAATEEQQDRIQRVVTPQGSTFAIILKGKTIGRIVEKDDAKAFASRLDVLFVNEMEV